MSRISAMLKRRRIEEPSGELTSLGERLAEELHVGRDEGLQRMDEELAGGQPGGGGQGGRGADSGQRQDEAEDE